MLAFWLTAKAAVSARTRYVASGHGGLHLRALTLPAAGEVLIKKDVPAPRARHAACGAHGCG